MDRRPSLVALPFLLALVPALPACPPASGPGGDATREAEDSTDVASSAAALTSLGAASTQAASEAMGAGGASDEEIATRSAASMEGLFVPAGCLTTTETGAVVTYDFAGCTGPYGLVGVDGRLTVTYGTERVPPAVTATLATDGLTVGGVAITGSAQVTARQAAGGAAVTLDVGAELAGETPRGRAVSARADLSATVDEAAGCASIDGSVSGSIGQRSLEVDLAGYRRCDGACPESGSMTVSSALATGTVTFDGDGTATLTTERDSREVPLACGG